jgi:penicillin-binding protein 1A
MPGLEPESPGRVASSNRPAADQAQSASQAYLAGTLSRRSYEVLGGIGSLFQSAGQSTSTVSQATDPSRQVAMP